MGYLYRHIRLDKNEPFYIGVSIRDDKYKRAYRKSDRNKLWKNIVNKTEYEVEILLDNLSEEELYLKEEEFIKLYGFIYNNTGTLSNLTFGGKGTKGSKHNLGRKWNNESRLKLSNSKKNITEETREKYRLSHLGKTFSLETRQKMSESSKKYIKTDTHKANLKKAQLNRKKIPYPAHLKKKVDQYDLNMNFIKTYDSISELGLIGFSIGNVTACCKGKRKTHKNFIFKYHNTFNIQS